MSVDNSSFKILFFEMGVREQKENFFQLSFSVFVIIIIIIIVVVVVVVVVIVGLKGKGKE